MLLYFFAVRVYTDVYKYTCMYAASFFLQC